MRKPARGPGSHTSQDKLDTWYCATFKWRLPQRVACALAEISRMTGRQLHYIARADMAHERRAAA